MSVWRYKHSFRLPNRIRLFRPNFRVRRYVTSDISFTAIWFRFMVLYAAKGAVVLCRSMHRSSNEGLANGVYVYLIYRYFISFSSFLRLFVFHSLKSEKFRKTGDSNQHHGTSSLNYFFFHSFLCVCVCFFFHVPFYITFYSSSFFPYLSSVWFCSPNSECEEKKNTSKYSRSSPSTHKNSDE